MSDELCATPTKSIVMCRAQAWLIAAERRGIDITKDPDGYLAVIAGLIAEVARQDERIVMALGVLTWLLWNMLRGKGGWK